MVDKYLKYSLTVSMALLVGVIIWLFVNYLKVFSFFPTISFLALLSYTLFILRLYLNNLHQSKLKWINWGVIFILTLPVFISVIQFFDTTFYEKYWPVVITLISIQSVLGIMATFGFFITRKSTPTIVNILVFLVGIYCVIWSVLVLTKSVINEVKQISLYVLIGLTVTLIIGNIIMYTRKGN